MEKGERDMVRESVKVVVMVTVMMVTIFGSDV
jgi:preprotein translocase subunit SecE